MKYHLHLEERLILKGLLMDWWTVIEMAILMEKYWVITKVKKKKAVVMEKYSEKEMTKCLERLKEINLLTGFETG